MTSLGSDAALVEDDAGKINKRRQRLLSMLQPSMQQPANNWLDVAAKFIQGRTVGQELEKEDEAQRKYEENYRRLMEMKQAEPAAKELRGGLYDLKSNKWIVPPPAEKPSESWQPWSDQNTGLRGQRNAKTGKIDLFPANVMPPSGGGMSMPSPNDAGGGGGNPDLPTMTYDPRYSYLPPNDAQSLGLPAQAPNVAFNISPKNRDSILRRSRETGQKQLQELGDKVSTTNRIGDKLDRFDSLMQQQSTGPVMGNKFNPIRYFDPQLSEMASISDSLAPEMRNGLPGAASDRDVAMFRSATVGPDKPEKTNSNIIQAGRAARKNARDYQQFMSDYLTAYGHTEGADASWNKYLSDNPIFDPTSKDGDPILNQGRSDYKTYFRRAAQAANGQTQGGNQNAKSQLSKKYNIPLE
ncbi:hypothetical protein UFOVP413_30 [uncultured Caudovirales phage]|uniref:Uncharacterized protein n=1 Tax=uncultured Caudovirales phage TaxID=2100421 RepID=A0A6J5M7H9_9CAUD|nr:hypothetical protein UFOVP413_30 [uncultured Caudovirales phage]